MTVYRPRASCFSASPTSCRGQRRYEFRPDTLKFLQARCLSGACNDLLLQQVCRAWQCQHCTFAARSKRFFGSGCALPKLLKCPASAFSVVYVFLCRSRAI